MKRAEWRGGWIVAALVLAAVCVGDANVAEAQDMRRQPRVLDLGEDILKGKEHKPEAFYILQHANLNYERLDAKETFIPELIKSVEDKPF